MNEHTVTEGDVFMGICVQADDQDSGFADPLVVNLFAGEFLLQ